MARNRKPQVLGRRMNQNNVIVEHWVAPIEVPPEIEEQIRNLELRHKMIVADVDKVCRR